LPIQRLRGAFVLGALALLCACPLGHSSDLAEAGPDGDSSGLQLGEALIYTLDWDRESVLFQGAQWSVVNELGFEFEIQQAYTTTYSLELVPCDPVTASDGGLGDLVERVLQWIGPRRAYAGHGGAPFNPTRLGQSMVEAVHMAEEVVSPSMTAQPTSYCQFHYLVARAHGGTQQMPEVIDMLGQSALVRGRWRRGEDPWMDFDWRSQLPWGEMIPLEPVPDAEGQQPGSIARVHVERPLAGLLKGLDPETMGSEVLANTLVKQMVQGTRIEIHTEQGLWRSKSP